MKLFIKIIILILIVSCSKSTEATDYVPVAEIEVNIDNFPKAKLSDYNFFKGNINNLLPNKNVLIYQPRNELFTDYASKKRFVWMPKNSKATFVNDSEVLDLPESSVLIKVFYYEDAMPSMSQKIIETRLMFKKNNEWIFASYIWNDLQTDAFLSNTGANLPVTFMKNGASQTINYQIPALNVCATCHLLNNAITPIGIKPQNLNFSINYTDTTSKNQLQKWIDVGYLASGFSSNINSVVNYNDVNQDLETRVRSYFDSQCGHCHRVGGNGGTVVDLRYTFNETENNPTNMGVCVPNNTSFPGINRGKIVNPQNPSQSGLFYTITSNNSFYRMPRIGRTIIDQEGVNLVNQWINALPACN